MKRKQVLFLLLLLAIGTGLRLWYGGWNLSGSRYWDEQYTLDNVRQVYVHHTVAPISGYYPSPVVSVPAAVVLWFNERLQKGLGSSYDAMDDDGNFDPTAYRLLRGLQTLYGVLGILFLFLIGKRVLSPADGLLAAALFTFMPWQIHASGYIKPDAQLVAFVLLACYGALVAVDRPTGLSHTWAGMAVGLAASPKITGVLAAIPLAVATLALIRREPRRLLLASWAGGAAFLTFVLLNPFWQHYLSLLSGLRRDYASRSGTTRWDIPRLLLDQILDAYGLGIVAGTLALGGTVLVVGALVAGMKNLGVIELGPSRPRSKRRRAPSIRSFGARRRLKATMLLAFPAIFVPVYVAQTPYFKGNNFLPVMALMTLPAAWATLALARKLKHRLPQGGRVAGVALVIAVVALAAHAGTRYVHHSVVPSTFDHATLLVQKTLRSNLGRVLVASQAPVRKTSWEGGILLGKGKSLLLTAEDADTVSWQRLLGVDAVIAPTRFFDQPDSALGRLLAATAAENVYTIARQGLETRGESLTALVRRFRPRPEHQQRTLPCPGRPTTDGCRRLATPPDLRPRETWNLVLQLGVATGSSQDPQQPFEVIANGSSLLLHPVSPGRWASERFDVPESALEVRLPTDWSPAARARAMLHALRWAPPRGTQRTGIQQSVGPDPTRLAPAAPAGSGTEATKNVPSPASR